LVFTVSALVVTRLEERTRQRKPRLAKTRILLNGVAVLDDRFLQLAGGHIVLTALHVLALCDLRVLTATDHQSYEHQDQRILERLANHAVDLRPGKKDVAP